MAEGGGGARGRAPALLEAARARYESLHISDDVFGESGPDSGGNPFYSTSAASHSSSAASSDDEQERPGPARVADAPEPEEGEAGAGWSAALRDRRPPRFEGTGGPTQKMPPSASAMDFFQLFIPDNALKDMVVQTNMYAKKFQERFGSDGAWAEVTLSEMRAFLGYMISTSISHCESVLSIWSGGFYSNRSLALVMSQARFERILKYFHVVAFRSSQTTHGLYKVQPFLDSLQTSFDSAFRPSQTQVLHEPLIDEDPVFIATCTERELRKRKKRKFSLWVRQCSSTGFIVQVLILVKVSSLGSWRGRRHRAERAPPPRASTRHVPRTHGRPSTTRFLPRGPGCRPLPWPWWQLSPLLLLPPTAASAPGRVHPCVLNCGVKTGGESQAHLLLCCALQILCFSQIEGLGPPCVIEQACRHHFPSSICSLPVSMSCVGDSCNMLNFFIILFVLMICD
ncbi:piggyBac transposable element-derived protein 5 isoform X2 [Manis javanica]|uniref:piggyBac transposable element-derived protein 5 isoform X2 n=1 Tax=Manis javanica TaxID=9974 RepID=UPI003C6D4377